MAKGAGRPSKLTQAVRDRIVLAIRGGNTYKASAEYGGVSYMTFNRWMEAGELQRRGQYRDFRDEVMRARNDVEVAQVATIRKAAQEGDWHAAAWWLERRNPDEWGRKNAFTGRAVEGPPRATKACTWRSASCGPVVCTTGRLRRLCRRVILEVRLRYRRALGPGAPTGRRGTGSCHVATPAHRKEKHHDHH